MKILRDGRDYENLYDAAMCRAEADWMVGINATRALTCKYNAQPLLRPRPDPDAGHDCQKGGGDPAVRAEALLRPARQTILRGLTLTWQDGESKATSSFDKSRIESIREAVKNGKAVVTKVQRTPKKTMPPLLYDLTELQRDASKRYRLFRKGNLKSDAAAL